MRSTAIVFCLICMLLVTVTVTAQDATPTLAPTVAPAQQPEDINATPTRVGCNPPLDLARNSLIELNANVPVRAQPSFSGTRLATYTERVEMIITNGPFCNEQTNWWEVDGGEPGVGGWIPEDDPVAAGQYFLQIVNPAAVTCDSPLPMGALGIPQSDLRVRAEPSLSATQVTIVRREYVTDVIGGPVCANGLNWWAVRAPLSVGGPLVTGWVAERDTGGALLFVPLEFGFDPTPTPQPCAPPYRRLAIGVDAKIASNDDTPKNVRTAPGLGNAVVTQLIEEVAFTIIDGPVCADGYNWWRVQVLGRPDVVGWLAEGGSGNLWIRPLVFD